MLARVNSVDAVVALNRLRTSYWEYRTFRADLLPEVTFDATLPSYQKSYTSYQLSDGSYTVVRNNNLQLNGALSVTQSIWPTGGTLSLNTSLKDNQVVRIGFKVPILDWGKRSGKVQVARSNREVVEGQIRQESMNFRQDIFVLVERFNNQREQVAIAVKADEVAQRRYDTNVKTFMVGKISVLDLNDSQLKKDEARREYIDQLYKYWYYYYQLRSITLYDYITGTSITMPEW